MQFKLRTRLIISLLCVLVLAFIWGWLGRQPSSPPATDRAQLTPVPAEPNQTVPATPPPLGGLPTEPATPTPSPASTNATAEPFPYRLRNTPKSIDELMRSDSAILLRNALIDVGEPLNLAIPQPLRATAEPGAYVVQARGLLDDAFRTLLEDAGARVVSYVPNNAYLVQVSLDGAERLAAMPQTQAVLPWEPYYKLDPKLLALAVEQRLLPAHSALNVLVFPDARDEAVRELTALGALVEMEEPSPFGTQLAVRAPETSLVPIARLATVQAIEPRAHRRPANDLTRARIRISTNATTALNYLGLTGAGVRVGVNDTGVDGAHPDLSGRVTSPVPRWMTDPNGHGTHVAGIIASSGANGPDGSLVPGSFTNSSYRGMASEAELFALPIDLVFGPTISDAYLQQTTALTNILISNNSWSYFGIEDYNMAAAGWDAAVRDAVPGVTGPQPLLVVFAAGNSGGGGGAGGGGRSDSINSPGTAKNVITVGAIENLRQITNEVTVDAEVSRPWFGSTDSSNQVASFSSRGNVGRGVEGAFGRFKPDVVAAGTMVVSTRSSDWTDPDGQTSLDVNVYRDLTVQSRRTNNYLIFVPPEGIQLTIQALTNGFSPTPLPNLLIYAANGQTPGPTDFVGVNTATFPVTEGDWFYTIVNTNTIDVRFDLRTVLVLSNNVGNYYQVLKDLNDVLAPHYRYESGTSQSAAAVSGLLALMQQHLDLTLGQTNSPALMKALLINGARTTGTSNPNYDFAVRNFINYQGWGLVNITNSLPASLTTGDGANGALIYYDQEPTRALSTGQSFTRDVTLSAAGLNAPLRFTLVWTDPPGNPAVSVKLVNDLDLIVTNLTTGEVYFGNNIEGGGLFSTATTNGEALFDLVNNVENVYIDRPIKSSTFSVTVRARRVNVDAVTTQTNGVQQDFALVISSGDPGSDARLTVSASTPGWDPAPPLKTVINGRAVINERVGANFHLLSSTNGITNQWNFYIVTNKIEGTNNLIASNIAFATFLPPNLSRPRYSQQADIDLYVSLDPNLTNLEPTALDAAWKSVRRDGTESIVLSNVVDGDLFYAGVKSEDQQAANYGFFAVSSQEPFSQRDTNGNIVFIGYPTPVEVPDGDPREPGGTNVFAFNVEPGVIQNVVVTNILTHELGGDLFGNLGHDDAFAVLNNHRSFFGTEESIYDESDSGNLDDAIPPPRPVDGPGSLRDFVGDESVGLWMLTEVDNSLFYTGRVDYLAISVEPRSDDLLNGNGIVRTILPGRFFYTSVDVPPDATNLMVCVAPDFGPVDVFLREGAFPTLTEFDAMQRIEPPGDCLTLTRRDSPPLVTGRYYIGIFNPNTTPVTVRVRVFIGRGIASGNTFSYRASGSVNLFDDAVTNSAIFVNRAQEVADVSVGVRIDHDRVSDLVLHLISPSGTRILLAENRGGPYATNYGAGVLQTNVAPTARSGGPAAHTNIIHVPTGEGTVEIAYEFYGIPDFLRIYYDNQMIFDSGLVSGRGVFSVDFGPGLATNVVVVMNEGDNSNIGTLWEYTATVFSGVLYATFTENTNRATVPIKFAPPPFTIPNFAITNIFATNIGIILDDGFDSGPAGGLSPLRVGSVFSGWQVDRDDVDIVHPAYGPFANYGMCVPSHSPLNGLDIDGFNPGSVSTNLTTIPNALYTLSFAYTRNPQVRGLKSARVSTTGNAPFTVGADPPNSCTNLLWQTTSVVFRATSPTTTLLIESLSPARSSGGVFFDSFRIDGGTNYTTNINLGIFYLPEEPLTPFIGENAFGLWQLEVWDNRIGAAVTNTSLLTWRLNLAFANTNYPVITLTNCTPYTDSVARQEIDYFKYNVPRSARFVTNHLNGTDVLDLLFSYNGPPQGNQPGDIALFNNVIDGIAVIATNGTLYVDNLGNVIGTAANPRLTPGRSYYLGVRHNNAGAATNIDYTLTVCADREDPNLGSIRLLTNGVTNCTIIAASTMDYFAFDVVSNATSVQFGLVPTSAGNLDLYVTKGLPVPTTNYFTAAGTNPGNAAEWIDITDQSAYTLGPARWYVGVLNRETNQASYCIYATQVVSRIIGFPGSLAFTAFGALAPPMDAGITNQVSVLAEPGEVIYFPITIRPNTLTAWFESFGTNGNVDLFVRPDAAGPLLPGGAAPTNAWYFSTNALANEFIAVSNTASVNALVPGTWIIAGVNRENFAVPYTVRVTQFTNELPTSGILTNFVAHPDTLTPSNPVDYYQFTVRSNPVQVVFETFNANGNVDLYVKPFSNVPLPGPGSFALASTNGGTTNEYIVTLPYFTNAPAAPGIWYLAVTNRSGGAVNYRIRARAYYEEDFVTLTNGLPYTNTVVASNGMTAFGFNYFRFVVSTNTFQTRFDLYDLTGNADLYVQKNLPLTNEHNFTYRSQNPGTTPDGVIVMTNTAPVTLSPGIWYLAVFNQTTNSVDYTITATETRSEEIFRLENGYTYTRTLAPRLTTSLSGTDYYLFQVRSNSFQAVFEVWGANGNVDLYVKKDLPIPDPSGFPLSSTNAGRGSEFIVILTNATPVALTDGDWYVAVVNQDLTNVTYNIRATALTSNEIVRVTNSVPRTRTMPPPGPSVLSILDHYLFTVSSNAIQVHFQVTDLPGSGELLVRKGLPVTIPWWYSSWNPGTNDEWVVVHTNSALLTLGPGDWYAVVLNTHSNSISYTFAASEVLAPQVTRLPTGVLWTTNVTPASPVFALGRDFYAFNVSSNALQVDCQVFPSGGNVDLYVSRNMPLPGVIGADYASASPGLANELVQIHTNSAPVLLAPGEWFLTVVNREPSPSLYSVRVDEFDPSRLVRLTNGIVHATLLAPSNAVPYSGVDYYVFSVSDNAVQATFETVLQAGNVDVFVRNALPLPGPANFRYAGTNTGSTLEWIPVTTNSTPLPLTPGDWYIAVVNRELVPVPYFLRATEVVGPQIVALTNRLAFANTVAASPSVYQLSADYYVFNVSAHAIQACFQTFGADHNVDLFVCRGLPLPDAAHFDYGSMNPGTTDEAIYVATNSWIPVPLTQGQWFLAVVNREATPASYSVRVTEEVVTPIVQLTNGVAYSNSVSACVGPTPPGVDYYRFTVSSNAVQAFWETFHATGNVDLYLRYGMPLPDPSQFDYAGTNLAGPLEIISVATNSSPVPLAPGDWYLAVVNRETNAVSYSVRVTEMSSDPPDVVTLTNNVRAVGTALTGDGSITAGARYYRFPVSSNAVAAYFGLYPLNGNVDLFIRRGLPLPTEFDFFYASTNRRTSNDVINVTVNSVPNPLLPGDWYLAVVNRETNAVLFSVEAIETIPTAIRLTNAVPYADVLPATNGAIRHYVFNVSSNAVRAQFEVNRPTVDVTLVLRRGLPLPGAGNYDYRSNRPGTNDELIVIYDNSVPVPLTPGDWYLGVINNTASAAAFRVKATESALRGTNIYISRVQRTADSLCLTWTNTLAGAHYFIQGRTELGNTNWTPVSPTITASGPETTWCLPLPTAYGIFRIAEGIFVVPAADPVLRVTGMAMTNGAFRLEWTGPVNQQYQAEWSPSLEPGSWSPFPGRITSFTGVFIFTDDGSQTGGLGPRRFYRFILLP